MFLGHVLIKIGIIAGCVILFLVTFVLNRRTKAPKIDEKIEKCRTCTNESCIIKLSDIEEIKAEYEKELKEHEGKVFDAFDSCEKDFEKLDNKEKKE